MDGFYLITDGTFVIGLFIVIVINMAIIKKARQRNLAA